MKSQHFFTYTYKIFSTGLSCLFCLMLLPQIISAQAAGALDPSFGSGGKVFMEFDIYTEGQDIVIKDNGNILVLARHSVAPNLYALSQYKSDGTIDESFADNGTFINDFALRTEVRMALQSDGKIVILSTTNGNPFSAVLVRHNVDGSIDSSFGNQGQTEFRVMGETTHGQVLTILDDNSIVVSGYFQLNPMPDQFIAKFSPDGMLDTSFGTNGFTDSDLPGSDRPYGLVMTKEGDFLTCGESGGGLPRFNITKYLSDGRLDTNFGVDGYSINTNYSTADALALQSDGKIVGLTAGVENSKLVFTVLRLNTDGSPDTDFGDQGVVKYIAPVGADPHSLTVDEMDRILICGEMYPETTNERMLLVRLLADGSVDEAFGTMGRTTTVFEADNREVAMNVAVQNDGKILIVGRSGIPFASGHVIVARFLPEMTTSNESVDAKVFDRVEVYPNPVGKQLNLSFSLKEKELLSIDLLDVSGRLLQTLSPASWYAPGEYRESWEMDANLPAGRYFIHLQARQKSIGSFPLVVGVSK